MRKISPSTPRRQKIAPEVVIPEKLYFRMGEVSRLTKIEPYVLRFWESKFPKLKPHKARSGHRLYRREDVKIVLTIKDLLYRQGFTIAGAKKRLLDQTRKTSTVSGMTKFKGKEPGELRVVKQELQGILTFLSRK